MRVGPVDIPCGIPNGTKGGSCSGTFRPDARADGRSAAAGHVMYIHVICPSMTQMELQALPCYCATLRQAARAATALYESVLGEGGVPLTQFTALQVMKKAPNLTTTELAELIGIDQTTATRTLAHIKKAGLARTVTAGDRR